ncbi:ABC transporter permease [Robbsia sp. Bb-Pol-6]|uniref:ABC transporter permease n=1 Tax=Robbsia betulipollinis TaxID=2981849 RepID=A0ABT3ZSR4_9BURK|nr:ABC transporter permease [Robbsia betulipollinis]MCY0389573.1 ABC transporter permease [Robbsia betulipollinis]
MKSALSLHRLHDQRILLPVASLFAVLIPMSIVQPSTLSYFGGVMLLNLAVPIVFATLAQLSVIAANELDLSIGSFISLVACIGGTLLHSNPALGVTALVACVLVYAFVGALIEFRRVSSVVVTLGLSFVWNGIAVLLLPTPGGSSPDWLAALMNAQTPLLPAPLVWTVVIALAAHLFFMRSAVGVGLRGMGGNPAAMRRLGWSVIRSKAVLFGLAGCFGVCSGLTLLGLTTSADANIALRYTLLSVAGVILGGGEFTGGRVSPVGAVLGAITLTLASSFLSFLQIAPQWQIGLQGAILMAVLSLRLVFRRQEARQ